MYLTQGLHRSLQQSANSPSTIFGNRTRTFSETAHRVARLAGALQQQGIQSGDRVAILSLNSDRYAEFFWAIPWADTIFVPLNVRWSVSEISYALNACGARALFVDEHFKAMVPDLRDACSELSTIVYCGEGNSPDGMYGYEDLISQSTPVHDVRRGGDEIAGIYFTGGTTGTPKGVMLTHNNFMTSAMGAAATGGFVKPGGRFLHAAPMFHVADGAAWCAQTIVGGSHVIISAFEPAKTLQAFSQHGVTSTLLVPTMVGALVNHSNAYEYDTTSVTHLVYGAAPMAETVLNDAMKLFPKAGFTHGYGMTELSPVISLLMPEDHSDPKRRVSAGRPAPHCELRILDEQGNELPRNTVGEIACRGDHVMRGYWNEPEATAEAVRNGWMHTGDGGYMDEAGYVYIVDRIKDMILTGGENVFSVEVENVLAQHPGIQSCAVIGVPDEELGEHVHAVIVPQPGTTVSQDEIREFCKSHIAGYKAPRSCAVVDALPISGAGKVLKRELRKQYQEAD